MTRFITCLAALCLACGLEQQVFANEYQVGDQTLTITSIDGVWESMAGESAIRITPGNSRPEPTMTAPKLEPVEPTAISVRVKVDQATCPHPANWYAFDLPRVRTGASIYFPWRNFRRFAGFTSQYRPRTIYNYGR